MRVILITGGTEGLGRAIAEKCLSEHTVVIASRSQDAIDTLCAELGCDGVVMDVTDCKSIENAVQYVYAKYGKIDCLINNAGVWIEGALETTDDHALERVMQTNLLGTVYSTKAVVPIMKNQRDGLIMNINSENGLRANSERSIYTASKWGVTGFTASLQSELAPFGIRVTGIHPGKMNTELFTKAGIVKKMDDALAVSTVADIVHFILSTPRNVHIQQLSVKALS